jgi:hypothetical protein
MGGKCNRMGPWITPPLRTITLATTTIYKDDTGFKIAHEKPPFLSIQIHP